MTVYFLKIPMDDVFNLPKANSGCYRATNFDSYRGEEQWLKLRDYLTKHFESINFANIFFTFSDPADEAAFLLWSSDGIDI